MVEEPKEDGSKKYEFQGFIEPPPMRAGDYPDPFLDNADISDRFGEICNRGRIRPFRNRPATPEDIACIKRLEEQIGGSLPTKSFYRKGIEHKLAPLFYSLLVGLSESEDYERENTDDDWFCKARFKRKMWAPDPSAEYNSPAWHPEDRGFIYINPANLVVELSFDANKEVSNSSITMEYDFSDKLALVLHYKPDDKEFTCRLEMPYEEAYSWNGLLGNVLKVSYQDYTCEVKDGRLRSTHLMHFGDENKVDLSSFKNLRYTVDHWCDLILDYILRFDSKKRERIPKQ